MRLLGLTEHQGGNIYVNVDTITHLTMCGTDGFTLIGLLSGDFIDIKESLSVVHGMLKEM